MEVKLNQSFPDPSKFTKEDEFLYAAKAASIFKKVVAELISYIEFEIPQQVETLRKKRDGEVDEKFMIGR